MFVMIHIVPDHITTAIECDGMSIITYTASFVIFELCQFCSPSDLHNSTGQQDDLIEIYTFAYGIITSDTFERKSITACLF